MKTLQRDQAGKLWDQYWKAMRHEWFKVEVLQDYAAEDEGPSLQKWLAGNQPGSIELMKVDDAPDFTAQCRQKLADGVKLVRYHVIEQPLTPYMEWEIEFYKRVSIPVRGEKVHLVNREDITHLTWPGGDFMIFDQKRAAVNTYNAQGLMTAETFYDESDDIGWLLDLRKAIKAVAKLIKDDIR